MEITPDITAELNDKGELIGIEILAASRFIRDSVMESVQAKLMGFTDAPPRIWSSPKTNLNTWGKDEPTAR